MSINDVMDAAVDYSNASWLDQDKARDALIAAIEQHVAEAGAKERERCAKMADEYATLGGSNFYDWFKKLATAIRARAEKETT